MTFLTNQVPGQLLQGPRLQGIFRVKKKYKSRGQRWNLL